MENYSKGRNISARMPPTSLPFIKEEEGSLPDTRDNIFRKYDSQPRKLNLLLDITYKCVGFREVKAYLSRVENRRKRPMNSWVKRSTESALSISRMSQAKVPQERYLSKEEVLTDCRLSKTVN